MTSSYMTYTPYLLISLKYNHRFPDLIGMVQFFEMPRYDAIKALAIYKRASMQVCHLLYARFVLCYCFEF